MADFECRFPYDSYGTMEGTEHHFGPFGRRILGQYEAAPCSPGPFGLLLIIAAWSHKPVSQTGALGISKLGQFCGKIDREGALVLKPLCVLSKDEIGLSRNGRRG